MKFKSLTLQTRNLESQVHFYEKVLGFSALSNTVDRAVFQVGETEIAFVKSDLNEIYHYCFLIPSNQLGTAVQWLEKRLKPIQIEGSRVRQVFEEWNAESVYFYDGDGNIAEFIVRHDLGNVQDSTFGSQHILSVNEMGLATDDISGILSELNTKAGIEVYKGNAKRFCAAGDLDGLFIIPNHQVKEFWFPTDIKIEPKDFQAVVENNQQAFEVKYQDGILSVKVLLS